MFPSQLIVTLTANTEMTLACSWRTGCQGDSERIEEENISGRGERERTEVVLCVMCFVATEVTLHSHSVGTMVIHITAIPPTLMTEVNLRECCTRWPYADSLVTA